MFREFEKIKADAHFQEMKRHFQNLRDVGNDKPKDNPCNCISGENGHGNCEADVCNHKKDSCYYRERIVRGLRHCHNTKFVECKGSRHNTADQNDQKISSGYR